MAAVKFTFDTVFEGASDVVSNAARARKRHSMTEADLEVLRAEAHEAGLKSGEVRALEAIATGTDNVVGAIREALTHAANEIESLRAHATEVALAAASKLARQALASFPDQEVERCLREAMHQAIGEPRLVLRAAPDVTDALKQRMTDIAHEEGFDGRVQITADPALAGADCRIEWRGGGAERTEAALEAALGELVARRFSQTAPAQLTED